jgi:hypothetical protein
MQQLEVSAVKRSLQLHINTNSQQRGLQQRGLQQRGLQQRCVYGSHAQESQQHIFQHHDAA